MWRWIKHWLDWVMNDLVPRYRMSAQQGLFFSFEKAGLRLGKQPIPWNAEAVVVEALVRLPQSGRAKSDFTLRLPNSQPVTPDSVRQEPDKLRYRLFFRLPPPSRTTTVQLWWKTRSLGELELPILQQSDFLRQLSLQLPTVSVTLGEQSIACQTFVSTQSKGFVASGLLTSPTSLVPILDMRLEVEFRHSHRSDAVDRFSVYLSSSQLQSKQALATVSPPNLTRRMGTWTVTWLLEGEPIHVHRIKAVSKRDFERSLRISETRFVVQDQAGKVSLMRRAPDLAEVARVGPCFLVSSREFGVAGLCTLQTRALVPGAVSAPLLMEHQVLITDGPTPFVPGTLESSELQQVTGFELCFGGQTLGTLPLIPAPSAAFTAEGAFQAPSDFTWTSAADDQLIERLSRLMSEN
ncbi:MAG: hypothetical protein ACFCD0_19640 [Gemmataceae bacterium]